MKIPQYEASTFLLASAFLILAAGLLTIFTIVTLYFNFNPWQAILDLFGLISSSKHILLSTLAISAILLLFFSAALFKLSFNKKNKRKKEEIESRENYMQIIMPFFKANECKLEKLRTDMWKTYNANAQNHTSHLLTIVVAIVGFIVGWETLSKDIVLGTIFLLVFFGGLALIFSWLILRNQYWSTLSSQIMVLSSKDIIRLFNDWNEKTRTYQEDFPPCSAVMTYALRQKIIETEKDCSWINNPRTKLVFRTYGV